MVEENGVVVWNEDELPTELLEHMDKMAEEELEAEQELYEFLSSEIEAFEQKSLRTKEDLIKSVASTRQKYQDESITSKGTHSLSFYAVLDHLFVEFEQRLSRTTLPEPLNDWWSYSYIITSYGIKLMMNYYEWSHSIGMGYTCQKGEAITVFEIPTKMLTISEYAAMNGVETVTVRQWIRRAKIRSAVKYGREWLIPELTEISNGKSYRACNYYWNSTLTGLPEKFELLNEFKNVLIEQSENRKDSYLLSFNHYIPNVYRPWSNTELHEEKVGETLNEIKDAQVTEDGKLIISGKTRAELELYLIGNPVVHQVSPWFWRPTELIDEYGEDYCGGVMWID